MPDHEVQQLSQASLPSTPADAQYLNSPNQELAKRFNELEKYVKGEANRLRKDSQDTTNLLVLGFGVLLVMVATIVVMVCLDLKNSNDRLFEKINSLAVDGH